MKRRTFAAVSVVVWLCGVALGAPACGGSSTPPAGKISPLGGKRPGDVYTAYVAAIGNASAVDELYPYLSSGRRKGQSLELEALKAKVPAGALKFSAEKTDGNKATLTVEGTIQGAGGKEEPSVGTVVLVREDGVWKVDQESWKAK